MNANQFTAVQVQGTTVETLLNEIKEMIKEVVPTPKPQHDTNELMTRKEVAKMLNISIVTLHAWTKKGLLTAYRIGNQVRYKKDEVIQALQQMNNFNNEKTESYHSNGVHVQE